MKNNASGNAGKRISTIVLIAANALMLVAGILTIPPNFREDAANTDAAVAAPPATSAAASASFAAASTATAPAEEELPGTTMPVQTPDSTMPTPVPLERAEELDIDLELRFEGEAATYSGVYTGEMLDGLPHGQGSFASVDRDDDAFEYTGQWSAGSFDGEGKIEWEHGAWRSGTFQGGLLNGPGQQYFNNILVFDGVYENHLMASGKLYDNSGQLFYEGDFREGQRMEDAAALEQRITGYNQICVPLTVEVWNDFANYVGQILFIDCEITKIEPDAYGTPELYFKAVLLDGDVQHDISWSSDYCPVYGEELPETGVSIFAFILVHEGPEGTYGQLLALSPY